MIRVLTVSAFTLVSSVALAQGEITLLTPAEQPPCDWSQYYGSPNGLSTQAGHNEIASGWACQQDQPVIDYIWDGLDFTAWWAMGVNQGFYDPCNPTYPIGRALTASMLMGYSGPSNPPTCNVKDPNMLNWALCWAASRYDELSTDCYTTSDALAITNSDLSGTVTWLMPAAMYSQEIPHLAGTIMHEARHWDCGHNGGSDCPRRRSCDEKWSEGCPWPQTGHGANRYQVVWLSWYANQGTRGSSTLKQAAVARAVEILEDGFTNVPCFTVALDGTPMDVTRPGCN